MSDEATRKAILARRARFVAAAMVGIGVAGCEKPQPCLSMDRKPTTDETIEPRACLKVGKPPDDETADAGAVDATSDALDATSDAPDASSDARDAAGDAFDAPIAHPCLKIAPPHPCLSMPKPCLSQEEP
jgi:hypothetical protein